jgi:hypothetical protein
MLVEIEAHAIVSDLKTKGQRSGLASLGFL